MSRINLRIENKFVSQIPKRFKEEYLEQEEVKLETKSAVHRDFHPIVEYFKGNIAIAFQCFKCSKHLANQNSLIYHLKNHENINNFVCEMNTVMSNLTERDDLQFI